MFYGHEQNNLELFTITMYNNYIMLCLSIFQPPHLRVKKIFVGGLKPETTDQQIRDYFGSHYAPVSCHFIILFRKIYLISLTEGFFGSQNSNLS